MRPRHRQCARMARQIESWLVKGIHPDPVVRHYIDSTFAHPTREELENLLKDPENCERDSLLELIFFPGQDLQVLWEDLIEQSCFSPGEASVILEIVMQKQPVAALFHPEDGPPACFTAPDHAVEQFIARLNLHKQIDSSVTAAIHSCLPGSEQLPARVMIRNAGFACMGPRADFLEAFMRNMPHLSPVIRPYLEFILHLLEAAPVDTPLMAFMAQQKRLYQKQIARARGFEWQRDNRNVETLILLGIRIPHFDSRDAMQKISMLDTVSLAIYGRIL